MNSQYEAKLKAVCNQCSLAQWHSLVKGEVALGMRDSLRLAFVAGARAALERCSYPMTYGEFAGRLAELENDTPKEKE